MTAQVLDAARAEAFAGEMLAVLNHGALALMVGIGHQTGLFDTLAGRPPVTSEELAAAAGLNERYVREWLGAMVCGAVIELKDGRYRLPDEHAASLTRAAGPSNLAAPAQFIAMLGEAEQQVVECFRGGGGVPYSAYPRFQQWMAENSGAVFDALLLDSILPLVPGLRERLAAGIAVADVGCGRGHAINLLARTFPASRFTGFDFSEQGLAAARAEAQALGLDNVRFVLQDVSTLSANQEYDLITAFDAIHDQAKPRTVLARIARALRPGGSFLMSDVAADSDLAANRMHPFGTGLYTISTMHCMTVSLALGGEGLGTMWGEQQARELLAEAGLVVQDVERVAGDPFNAYYIATPAA